MGKKNFTRRQFMATMAAGTGTVIMGNAVNAIPSDMNSPDVRSVTDGYPWKNRDKNHSSGHGNRL